MSNSQNVSAKCKTIKDILELSLSIPEYQRPYTWNIRNINQLLDDIYNAKQNNNRIYHLGSVILHNNNIVDGQQRLTSIILLLKALKYEGKQPDLKFSHTISFKNIKANYQEIISWINTKNHDSLTEYILTNCQMVVITVKEQSEAFQMFESQNGRGKELEPYNLLKAYHIRAMSEEQESVKIACDKRWEAATMFYFNGCRLDLLRQLFNEQLYRTRIWAKGGKAGIFSKKEIDEFKGITIDSNWNIEYPFQNNILQQKFYNRVITLLQCSPNIIQSRFISGAPKDISPYVNICQWIINGQDFFEYIKTYVEMYKLLFLDNQMLNDFYDFYKKYCLNYSGVHRVGDSYIREIYKSAIMLLFDKFGEYGLYQYYKDIYFCLYSYRAKKERIYYSTMADEAKWVFQLINNSSKLSELSEFSYKAKIAKELKPLNDNITAYNFWSNTFKLILDNNG